MSDFQRIFMTAGLLLGAVILPSMGAAEIDPSTLAWAKHIDGGADDSITVRPFDDGSFIILAPHVSVPHLVTPPEPGPPYHKAVVAKYDAAGCLLWRVTFSAGGTSKADSSELPSGVFFEELEIGTTPDGSFVLAGYHSGDFVLGEGQDNEVALSDTNFIAAYHPDGTLNWARQETRNIWHLAVSPDGTSYLSVGGTMESGGQLTCYDNAGNLQWTVPAQYGYYESIVAMNNSCICYDFEMQDITHHARNGSILSRQSVGHLTSLCRLSGTQSLLAIGDYGTKLRKFSVATGGGVSAQWSRATQPELVAVQVCGRSDSSGAVAYRDARRSNAWIQPFDELGTLGDLFDVGHYVRLQVSVAPTAPGVYFCVADWELPRTFGASQLGEVTFSSPGPIGYDYYIALYGREPQCSVNVGSIGPGTVELEPSLGHYPVGTVVTARAVPLFPEHDRLAQWQGDLAGNTSPEVTFTVEHSLNFTAVFEPIPLPPQPPVTQTGFDTFLSPLQITGTSATYVTTLRPFADGSFILFGRSRSAWFPVGTSELLPGLVFVAKFDKDHRLIWNKSINSADFHSLQCDALSDGSFWAKGGFRGEITLGEGESNESHFVAGENETAEFLAAFNSDGTLRWASFSRQDNIDHAHALQNLSVSPDGTCYAICQVDFSQGPFVLAAGTPGEITVQGKEDFLVVCYDRQGHIEWTRALTGCPSSAIAMADSLVVYNSGEFIHYGRDNSIVSRFWASYYPMRGGKRGAMRIPGQQSFVTISAYLKGEPYEYEKPGSVHKFTVEPDGTLTKAWTTRTSFTPDQVCAYPDGSGFIVREPCVSGGTESWMIQPFTAEGVLGPIYEPGVAGLASNPYNDLVPAFTPPGFYICGLLQLPLLLGAGEPTQTTLVPQGTGEDGYVAIYGGTDRFNIQATKIGYGSVWVTPQYKWYVPGSEATVHAATIFPTHDQFVGWEGDLAGFADSKVTFQVNQDMDVTAVFEELPGVAPLPAASIAGLALLGAAIVGVARLRRR